MNTTKIDQYLAKVFLTEYDIPKLRKFYRSLNNEEQIYFLTHLQMDVQYLTQFGYHLWDKLLKYNLVLRLNPYYLSCLLQHIERNKINNKRAIPLVYANEIFSRIMAAGDKLNMRAIYKKYFVDYLRASKNPQEIYNKFVKTKDYEGGLFFSANKLSIKDMAYLSQFIKYKHTKDNLKSEAAYRLSSSDEILTLNDRKFFDNYILPERFLGCSDIISVFIKTSTLMTKEREKEFIKCYIDNNNNIKYYNLLSKYLKFNDNQKIIQSAIFIHQLIREG
jgi:hypothetical protein